MPVLAYYVDLQRCAASRASRCSTMRRDKGWTAAGKARVPLMLVGLMDVLHAFPGQIPDMDAVLSVADFPCVPMRAPCLACISRKHAVCI